MVSLKNPKKTIIKGENMNYTTIYFKIENQYCEEKGYVEIYDDDEYIPEFYYWNYNTGYECKEIVCHKNERIGHC